MGLMEDYMKTFDKVRLILCAIVVLITMVASIITHICTLGFFLMPVLFALVIYGVPIVYRDWKNWDLEDEQEEIEILEPLEKIFNTELIDTTGAEEVEL